MKKRDEAMTLWDGEIAMRKETVPPAAFEPGARTCAAMAPDGVTLLMVDGAAPYLYELKTHKWVELFPKNDSSAKAAEELGLFGTGDFAGPYPLSCGFTHDGNYLLAGAEGHYAMVIDCEDAGFYMVKEGRPASIHGNEMLVIPAEPGSGAIRVDLQTGEQITEVLAGSDGFGQQETVCTAAHYLEDGSICSLLQGKEASYDRVELSLEVQGPKESQQTYGLGTVPADQAPDRLCSVGDRYIIAGTSGRGASFLIDRQTQEISNLNYQDKQIAAAALSEQQEGGGLILWGLLADKQAVLMQEAGGNGALLIYRPDLGKTQQFITDTADNCFAGQQTITGNYYGRYVMQPFNSDNTYTQLGIRELEQ